MEPHGREGRDCEACYGAGRNVLFTGRRPRLLLVLLVVALGAVLVRAYLVAIA
jgi:hypothetical protein